MQREQREVCASGCDYSLQWREAGRGIYSIKDDKRFKKSWGENDYSEYSEIDEAQEARQYYFYKLNYLSSSGRKWQSSGTATVKNPIEDILKWSCAQKFGYPGWNDDLLVIFS